MKTAKAILTLSVVIVMSPLASAKSDATIKPKALGQVSADETASPDAEGRAKAEAEAQQKAEAEARQKAEAEARQKTETEAKAKAEAEAKAKTKTEAEKRLLEIRQVKSDAKAAHNDIKARLNRPNPRNVEVDNRVIATLKKYPAFLKDPSDDDVNITVAEVKEMSERLSERAFWWSNREEPGGQVVHKPDGGTEAANCDKCKDDLVAAKALAEKNRIEAERLRAALNDKNKDVDNRRTRRDRDDRDGRRRRYDDDEDGVYGRDPQRMMEEMMLARMMNPQLGGQPMCTPGRGCLPPQGQMCMPGMGCMPGATMVPGMPGMPGYDPYRAGLMRPGPVPVRMVGGRMIPMPMLGADPGWMGAEPNMFANPGSMYPMMNYAQPNMFAGGGAPVIAGPAVGGGGWNGGVNQGWAGGGGGWNGGMNQGWAGGGGGGVYRAPGVGGPVMGGAGAPGYNNYNLGNSWNTNYAGAVGGGRSGLPLVYKAPYG